MTNLEALETLVNSRILQVKLLGSENDAWGVKITTADGEAVVIMVSVYENLSISVKTG